MSQEASRIGKLILVPAVITLAVTLLRLVGELQGWSPALFNRGEEQWSPALVGIVWLVPVFGAWFGWKLTRAGSGPGSLGRAFGLTLASLAVLPLFAFLAPKAGVVPERMWGPNVPLTESLTILSVFVAFAIVGLAMGILAWPALGRTLLAYGLAARIPVALLMLVAMLGNWGTHYDARPSYPPEMSTLGWWVTLGLVPQLFFWIWYTIVFGALFGIVAAAIARRRGTAAGETAGRADTAKGKDAAGRDTRAEFLTRPQLKLDVGSMVGRRARVLELGVGFDYWHNMFGKDADRVPGARQLTPVFTLAVHLPLGGSAH